MSFGGGGNLDQDIKFRIATEGVEALGFLRQRLDELNASRVAQLELAREAGANSAEARQYLDMGKQIQALTAARNGLIRAAQEEAKAREIVTETIRREKAAADDDVESKMRLLDAEGRHVEALRLYEREIRTANAAHDQSAKSMRQGQMAAIELTRAFEDISVAGPIAAVNNLNRVVEQLSYAGKLSTGQMILMSGALVGLGFELQYVYRHWDEFVKLLAQGLPAGLQESLGLFEKPIRDIEAFKERIEELRELGPSRLEVDTRELEDAEKEIDRLTKRKQAFDALMGKQTAAEAASGKRVAEIFGEIPGGPEALAADLRAPIRAAEMMARQPELDPLRAREGRLIEFVRRQEAEGNAESLRQGQARLASVREQIRALEREAAAAAQARVEGIFAEATTGRGPAQGQAQQQIEAALRARGDVGGAIQMGLATPEQMALEERGKQQAKNVEAHQRDVEKAAQEEKRALDAAASARQQVINREVSRLTSAADDPFRLDVLRGIAGGQAPPLVAAGLAGRLRGAMPPGADTEEVAAAVAEKVVEKFAAEAYTERAVAGGDLPGAASRLIRQAEDEAGAKGAKERQRRIAELARDNVEAVQGRRDFLTQNVVAGIQGGLSPKAIEDRLAPGARRVLGQIPGFDPAMVEDVAAEMVRREIAARAPEVVGGVGRWQDAGRQRNVAEWLQGNYPQFNPGMNPNATDEGAMQMAGRILDIQERTQVPFAIAVTSAFSEQAARLGRIEQQMMQAMGAFQGARAQDARHRNTQQMMRGTILSPEDTVGLP